MRYCYRVGVRRFGSEFDARERVLRETLIVPRRGGALRIAEPLEVELGRVVHVNDGHEDEHVHDVVRVEEEIEPAGEVALGHAQSPYDAAEDRDGVLHRMRKQHVMLTEPLRRRARVLRKHSIPSPEIP